MKRFFYLIIILFSTQFGISQTNISAKVSGFSINPFNDVNKHLYSKPFFDTTGILTFEPGFQLAGEFYGKTSTSVKVLMTVNKDQVGNNAGFAQFMIRYKFLDNKKIYMHVGVGPVFHYRKTWQTIPNYMTDNFYNYTNGYDYKFWWLSGEIELSKKTRKDTEFCMSINHYHPKSIGLFFGIKYWISRRNTHCNTCPSYN